MKKQFFPVLIGLMALSNILFAQDKKTNSISAGYGVVTFQDVGTIVSDILIDPVTLGTVETTNINSSGAPFVEFSHYWTNHWRFVVNGNYSIIKSDFVLGSDHSSYGSGTDQFYTVMVGINYHWIAHSIIELYSGLQIGGSYWYTKQVYDGGGTATDHAFLPAFQVTPIGLRVGKGFAGFAELGFGDKGIADIGLDLRF